MGIDGNLCKYLQFFLIFRPYSWSPRACSHLKIPPKTQEELLSTAPPENCADDPEIWISPPELVKLCCTKIPPTAWRQNLVSRFQLKLYWTGHIGKIELHNGPHFIPKSSANIAKITLPVQSCSSFDWVGRHRLNVVKTEKGKHSTSLTSHVMNKQIGRLSAILRHIKIHIQK